jgi:hypothetical protein
VARHERGHRLGDRRQGVGDESDESAAPVAVGGQPFDESGLAQHPEVMSHEIGADPKCLAELGPGSLGQGQLIDDLQAVRVGQGRMDRNPFRDRRLDNQ